jgi:iron(III) transport system ATP-binding protein
MSKLRLSGIEKRYGDFPAVAGLDLDLQQGEFVSLLGPSGCGKTTTLRMIAGFIDPTAGTIEMDGKVLSSPSGALPPEKRQMSMIFQSYAVWPNMTVQQNVAFGLELRKLPREEVRRRVGEMLEVVHMGHLAARYPAELSGGQQQRVALARALVLEPEILLFDEPLSNLDATLREHMRFEIKTLLGKLKITCIYVTHDQSEAMVIADRVAVMNRGRIEQLGSPEDIYYRSETDFVAQFIGLANVLDAKIVGPADPGLIKVSVEGVGDIVARAGRSNGQSPTARLFLRPEHIELAGAPRAGMNTLKGKVTRRSFVGAQTDYVVDVNGVALRVISSSRDARYQPSQDVLLSFAPADCLLLGN